MPIRADQFLTFSLLLKSSTICTDCLYISSYNKNVEEEKTAIKDAINGTVLKNSGTYLVKIFYDGHDGLISKVNILQFL